MLTTLLVAINADFLLRKPLHETGDPGSYALSIDRAERWHELYGHYSRYGFHHPGPGYFYLEAAGENLLANWTGLVPAPFNALIITVAAITSFWFALALQTCARWLSSAVFLPLALGLGLIHFGAVGPSVFLSSWPPHVMAMTFLVFLVLSASVGAGDGWDLPWLGVAGGLLVHSHVAQPLFVVPLSLMAYVGLVWHAHRAEQTAVLRGETTRPVGGPLSWLGAGLRTFPGSHGWAAAWLALLALPFLLDVCLAGSQGNLAAVLAEVEAQHRRALPRSFWQALNYWINFGGYDQYQPGRDYLDHIDARGLWRYVRKHPLPYVLWAGVIGAVLGHFVAVLRRRVRTGLSPNPGWSGPAVRPDRTLLVAHRRERFFGSLVVFTAAATGLTLVWGMKQDDKLFYWNAWFDYSIYYAWALAFAAAVTIWLEPPAEARARPAPARGQAPGLVPAVVGLGYFLVFVLGWWRAPKFRDPQLQHQDADQLVASFQIALRTNPPDPARPVFLDFEHDAWGSATGLAVLLERHGYRVRVPESWRHMFGQDLAPENPRAGLPDNQELTVWRLLPSRDPAAQAACLPLLDGYGLVLTSPRVTPAAAASPGDGTAVVDFGGHGNFLRTAVAGWSTPDPEADSTWTDQSWGLLQFSPVPVPASTWVEVSLEFSPFLVPPRLSSQRCEFFFNGRLLAACRVDQENPPPWRVPVPAAVWNSCPTACLGLRFPDATPPRRFKILKNDDSRPLAFACRKILFALRPNGPDPTPGRVEIRAQTSVAGKADPDCPTPGDTRSLVGGGRSPAADATLSR